MHCLRCRKEGPPGAQRVCFLPRFKLHKLASYLEAAKRQPQLNTIRGRPLGIERPVKMAGYCLNRGEQELTKECLVAKIELIEANTLLEVLKEHAGEAAIAGLAVAGGPDEPARQKRRAEEVVRLAIEGKGASCISFNLRSSAEWGSKLAQVCEHQRADEFHFEYTSRPSTTRVMIGNIGKGMGWRVDRTDARSIALGVSGVQSQSLVLEWGALALWFMIGPHLVAEADEWTRTHTDHKNGFKDLDHANQLEDSEFESLWRCLFAADGNYAGAFDAFTLHQYAGEMVCVPPGWLYAVRILQPCLQLEWSFIDPVNFVQYVRSERLVCRPFTVSPRDNIALQYELWYRALSK